MGTWDLGRETRDLRTSSMGRGDAGTRGRGDAGTSNTGDVGDAGCE